MNQHEYTYISIWITVALDGLDPLQHRVVVVGLEEKLGSVVRCEAEHVFLLRVVVRDVNDARLYRDRLLLHNGGALQSNAKIRFLSSECPVQLPSDSQVESRLKLLTIKSKFWLC